MATVQNIINSALRRISALDPGVAPTASETSEALESLNYLIDSWQNDRLLIYAVNTETLPMVSGTSSYTIGPTGDLVTTRPLEIEAAYMRLSTSDISVKIINSREFASIVEKASSSDVVKYIYYQGTMPNGTIHVWPTPSTTNSLYVSTRIQLTEYASASTTVTLPPGYKKALIDNLAVELAPEYRQQVPRWLEISAYKSKRAIKLTNSQPIKAGSDLAHLFGAGRTNIVTDI